MNVLLAEGVNLGLRKMAAATNTHSFWELLIARWHVEGSAYDRALAMIVEAHADLPMAAFWGQGTPPPAMDSSSSPPSRAKP
jgi:TnpA family transposase